MIHKPHAALIGCGDVAVRYVSALADAGFELRAVTDVDRRTGEEFGGRFGVDFVPSLDALLALPVELVCVCTPGDSHPSLVHACLSSGRNAVVEHPPAVTVPEAEELSVAAARHGRSVFVMRQMRYLPSVQALKAEIEREAIGAVRRVTATMCWSRSRHYYEARPWRRRPGTGGVVLNQASHFLDILLYLFPALRFLRGTAGNVRHELPVEDTFLGAFALGDATVEFRCTTAAPPGHNRARLVVEGSDGTVVLGGRTWGRVEPPLPAPSQNGDGSHAAFLRRVRKRLDGEDVEVVEAASSLPTVRMIDRIQRTAARDTAAVRVRFRRLLEDGSA